MKQIALSRGMITLVDDEDYEYLNQFKWCAKETRGKFYAGRSFWKKGVGGYGKETIHRVVTGAPDGQEVDHINGNSLDNRKENLRFVTHAENMRNYSKPKNNTSGVVGVQKSGKGTWRATVHRMGKLHIFGEFDTVEEAAKARSEGLKLVDGT